MKIYTVYDSQFNLFSDPFLSADDTAAERLLVQTALMSEGFRKRVSFNCLYCIGSFDPDTKWDVMPLRAARRPKLVCSAKRLISLVTQCEEAQRAHLSTVSASDPDPDHVDIERRDLQDV